MTLEKYNPNWWQGRIDTEDGIDGLRLHQVIQEYNTTQHYSKVLVGFCSDEGVKRNKGRLGAKEAPNEIRKALANLPIHHSTQKNKIADAGNIICDDENLEKARAIQVEIVSDILSENQLAVVLGGGHETALGNFLALAKHHQNIGIINIDAHFDLRKPTPISTSGTPFYEMQMYCRQHEIPFNYCVLGLQENGNTQALFKRADEFKVDYIMADEIHSDFNQVLEQLKPYISQFEAIYITLDMDVFDVAFAPGVSAPSINGLTPFQVKYLLKLILKSNKVKLMDVVEVNPNFDRDAQTAKLAAHMVNEVLKYKPTD